LNLKEKNREISLLLQNIVDLQHKIDANKEAILSYLAYVYKKGDGIYDSEQEFDIIKTLVFTDGNVSDVLANYHFSTIIEITGQSFLEERRKLLSEFYIKSQELKTQRRNLADLKRQLLEEQKSLESQKEFKQFLLERTMGREALYNEYIAEQKQKQDVVESRLIAIQDLYFGAFESIATRYGCTMSASGSLTPITIENTTSCESLAVSFEREKQLRQYTQSTVPLNPLAWPVDGTYISSYFQDADYYASVGSSHEGIDIPVPQSTEIKAPMAGYVYFINEPTQNGYGYMAIKHPNGFMTVYGHISEVLVDKFAFVEAGQVFAKSGGAPGTPGAGVMSSGAHLHYEVWLDQKTVDPLRYMDITRLRFESLTTKYKYKFIEDLKLRYGYRANTEKYNSFMVQ
jgi:murein DD-endopeptidase MepM/ murein hydrolase activator NlpD